MGVIATLNIPIGGKSRSNINRAIAKEVQLLDLQYASQYYSACTAMEEKGIVVIADETFANELDKCSTRLARVNPVQLPSNPAPTATTRSEELEAIKAELAQLRMANKLMLEQLQNRPVKGPY